MTHPAPTRRSSVSLRPKSEENVLAIIRLDVAENQKDLVAPNSVSITQAAQTTNRWERAIYAADEPVDYVLLSEDRDKPRYYLWRYMIDHPIPGHGFRPSGDGTGDRIRADAPQRHGNVPQLCAGRSRARSFYAGLGFEDTGVEHGGELEMRLIL